ncbi:S9 family peptidase [uncultured Parasphingorhabdus sp.]|uniref:dipeptidyl-peptidase 5 n=1 Tax=uncultured Parasphingorhabdus sp. TaxID=2709694 RepID=UPI0030DA0E79|tara:strand:- start:27341 stop:29434 length:2094 start_codon:yes stop_codon:yes gene_type:complete
MTKYFKTFTTALFLTGAIVPTLASARPMTPEDLATLKRMGSVSISPDEKWAAYDVTETQPETYERSSALYLLDIDAADATPVRILDAAGKSEHSPAFAPDGSLYYLSDASGSEQLWHADILSGDKVGKPVQASDLKADIAGFKLSQTGKQIALWGDIARDCPTFGCDESGNRAEPGPGTGREYDELFIRHWSSWETPGNYSRIFAFELKDGKIAGEGSALDGDLTGDSPSKPFGGGEEIAWVPGEDGVFFALRVADRNEPKSTNIDIYGAKADGKETVNFTANNKATDTLPAFSSDGEWLAWAAMERPGYEADRLVVKLRKQGSDEDEAIALTKDWDRSVGSIVWTPDNKYLIVTAQDVLDHPAFAVEVATGKVTRLTAEGNVGTTIPLQDGSLIYTMNSLQAPTDIYRRTAGGNVTQLTNINGRELAEIDKVEIKRFNFPGANGDTVWGQIIKPQGATGKLPMAFLVHGGPQSSFGNNWSTRWNPKVMAAQGYAAVTVDFHGSAGYGQKFTDSINQDWGGKPLEDLKLGYAAALKIDPQIDGERSCALGGSYGGYMMNWIAGNWPDRFDCLINHAGVFDLRAMALSTEELWFDQWDHGGNWWSRPNPEKWNPVNKITNWKTPTLFIHGEKDFRIPYTQTIMPFTVSQEMDIPSKLLIFPDENHWVLKGKNSVQWYRTVFDWMDKWTAAGNQESEGE